MSTQLDSVSICGMRPADFRQLETYISHIEEEGVYWGNKDQFFKRHKRLKDWVEGICERVYDRDYVIAKE